MKKRSILAISLSLATLFSLSLGCVASAKVTPAASAKVTIKVGNWPDSTDKVNVALFKTFQKQFEKKYPNVTVVADHYDYAVDTYAAMSAAGSAPTLIQTWFTEPQKLIRNKMVADCTQEVKAMGWDTKMSPSIKKMLTGPDGHLYGIPRDGYGLGLMINLDLWKKAGLMNADGKTPNYPKTFNELAKDAQTVKQKTGKAGFCLLAMDANSGWHFSNIAWNFGASLELLGKNDKYVANFTDSHAVAAMQFVKDLQWKYNVLTSSPTTLGWAQGFTQLGTGNAAMLIAANDAVSQPTTTNGLKVGSLALEPMPAGPGGKQYSLMGGTPYVFAKNATPAQITACLNWIVTIGKGPVVSKDSLAGMESNAVALVKAGTPNIPIFPAWTDKNYITETMKAVNDHPNVNMALYNNYFTFIKKPNALHAEEPVDTQNMYTELNKVIQKVITDKNADVKTEMSKANSEFQNMLDKDINR
jgi:ABC-type sugar transport system, periplasmic component